MDAFQDDNTKVVFEMVTGSENDVNNTFGKPTNILTHPTLRKYQSLSTSSRSSSQSMKTINIGLSVCLLLMGLSGIAYLVFDLLVKTVILHNLVLRNNSEFANVWTKPPTAPHLKVYFFNFTNAEDFFSGKAASPHVEEVGPYVYHQEWMKEVVAWNDNGSLTYRIRKTFKFMPELSVGHHAMDTLIVPNVPVISAFYQMRSSNYFMQLAIEALIYDWGYKMWTKRTAEELIWGYDEPLFDLAKMTLPNAPTMNKFGFFIKDNVSSELLPLYTMFTGEKDYHKLGQIFLFKGDSSLHIWGSGQGSEQTQCNLVKGSDGANFGPYMRKTDVLWFFNDKLCRSVPLVFEKEVMLGKLPGFRFIPGNDVFMTPESVPENSCFCDDEPLCDLIGDGMFPVSQCQFDAPIVLSWPHFLGANSKYVIKGLKPVPELHNFYFDLQQTTGTTLAVKARIQINIAIPRLTAFADLSKINDTIMPILWFDEGLDGPGQGLEDVLSMAVTYPPIIKKCLLYIFTCFLLLTCVVAFLAAVLLYKRHHHHHHLEVQRDEMLKELRQTVPLHSAALPLIRSVQHEAKDTTSVAHMLLLECGGGSSTSENSAQTSRTTSTNHSRNSSTDSNNKQPVVES